MAHYIPLIESLFVVFSLSLEHYGNWIFLDVERLYYHQTVLTKVIKKL